MKRRGTGKGVTSSRGSLESDGQRADLAGEFKARLRKINSDLCREKTEYQQLTNYQTLTSRIVVLGKEQGSESIDKLISEISSVIKLVKVPGNTSTLKFLNDHKNAKVVPQLEELVETYRRYLGELEVASQQRQIVQEEKAAAAQIDYSTRVGELEYALEGQKATYERKLEAKDDGLADLQARNNALEETILGLTTEKEVLEGERKQLKKEMAMFEAVKADKEKAEAEAVKAKEALDMMKSEKHQLQMDLQRAQLSLESQGEKFELQKKPLEDEIKRLENALEEARAQITNFQQIALGRQDCQSTASILMARREGGNPNTSSSSSFVPPTTTRSSRSYSASILPTMWRNNMAGASPDGSNIMDQSIDGSLDYSGSEMSFTRELSMTTETAHSSKYQLSNMKRYWSPLRLFMIEKFVSYYRSGQDSFLDFIIPLFREEKDPLTVMGSLSSAQMAFFLRDWEERLLVLLKLNSSSRKRKEDGGVSWTSGDIQTMKKLNQEKYSLSTSFFEENQGAEKSIGCRTAEKDLKSLNNKLIVLIDLMMGNIGEQVPICDKEYCGYLKKCLAAVDQKRSKQPSAGTTCRR